MFIGHFAVGFGAKKYSPGISLGILFAAAQFLDLLWPSLLLLDIEHVQIAPGNTKMTPLDFYDYPVSHSLLMVAGWATLLGLICWFITKNIKYSAVIFICVASHWFLDLLMHRPDLPLMPGNAARVGFGLWNYPFIASVMEASIFIAGVWLYYRNTVAKNNFGKYGLLTLVALLAIIHVMNMVGPPPPSVTAIAWAGQLQWLFVVLAFYVDRNRMPN